MMPHIRHIYAKVYDTERDTMCAYTQSYHAITHRKHVLRYYDNFTCINIPDQ